MRPQKQLFRHNPDAGVWGDCERAAWATLLDLDVADVPHFFDAGVSLSAAIERMRAFEKTLGLYYVSIPFTGSDLDAVLTCINHNNADAEYLLCGTSRTGCNHTVVCKGNQIVHDPAINNSGIVGPADDGFYWVTVFTRRQVAPATATPPDSTSPATSPQSAATAAIGPPTNTSPTPVSADARSHEAPKTSTLAAQKE